MARSKDHRGERNHVSRFTAKRLHHYLLVGTVPSGAVECLTPSDPFGATLSPLARMAPGCWPACQGPHTSYLQQSLGFPFIMRSV
jgi:hypothetical protein